MLFFKEICAKCLVKKPGSNGFAVLEADLVKFLIGEYI